MRSRDFSRGTLFASLLLAGATFAPAQTIVFEERFDADASANFTEVQSYDAVTDTDGNGDIVSNYFFNYATVTAQGTPYAVPEAPSSGTPTTATTGAFLQANVDAASEAAALISIFPAISALSGPHSLQFDFFAVVGSPGTTEYVGGGLLTSGTNVNPVFQVDPLPNFTTNLAVTDGYYVHFTVEGGSGTDISFLEGDTDPGTTEFAIPADGSAGFLWDTNLDTVGNNDSVVDMEPDSRSNYFGFDIETWYVNSGLFGTQVSGEADGPNEAWVTFRMTIDAAGVLTFEQNIYDGNGFVTILTYDDPDDTWTSGIPMISLFDHFGAAGSSNPDSGVIIDNVIVTDLTTNVQDWSLY